MGMNPKLPRHIHAIDEMGNSEYIPPPNPALEDMVISNLVVNETFECYGDATFDSRIITKDPAGSENYIYTKTVMVQDPLFPDIKNPILWSSEGFWAIKDVQALGALFTTSKTTLTFGATYTNCIPSDIGKMVKDDGVNCAILAEYDNTNKKWYLGSARSVASGSAMTIVQGTGSGTTSAASSATGGAAILMGHGFVAESDSPRVFLVDSALGYSILDILQANNSHGHIRAAYHYIRDNSQTEDGLMKYDGTNNRVVFRNAADSGYIQLDPNCYASGGGDMLKSTYDTDLDNIVDNSELVNGFQVGQNLLTTSDAVFNSAKGMSSAGAIKAGNELTLGWDTTYMYITSHNKHLYIQTPSGYDVIIQRQLKVEGNLIAGNGKIALGTDGYLNFYVSGAWSVNLFAHATDVLATDDNLVLFNAYLNINPTSGTPVLNWQRSGTTKGFIGHDDTKFYITSDDGNLEISVPTGNEVILAYVGNFRPSTVGGVHCGTAAYHWNSVWADHLRYDESLEQFDALDDLAIVQNYKSKTIVRDGVPIDVIDKDSMPQLLDEHGFYTTNRMSGFLLGCIKQLTLRLEKAETEIATLKGVSE